MKPENRISALSLEMGRRISRLEKALAYAEAVIEVMPITEEGKKHHMTKIRLLVAGK